MVPVGLLGLEVLEAFDPRQGVPAAAAVAAAVAAAASAASAAVASTSLGRFSKLVLTEWSAGLSL